MRDFETTQRSMQIAQIVKSRGTYAPESCVICGVLLLTFAMSAL